MSGRTSKSKARRGKVRCQGGEDGEGRVRGGRRGNLSQRLLPRYARTLPSVPSPSTPPLPRTRLPRLALGSLASLRTEIRSAKKIERDYSRPAGPDPMMTSLLCFEGFSAAAPPLTSIGAMAVAGEERGVCQRGEPSCAVLRRFAGSGWLPRPTTPRHSVRRRRRRERASERTHLWTRSQTLRLRGAGGARVRSVRESGTWSRVARAAWLSQRERVSARRREREKPDLVMMQITNLTLYSSRNEVNKHSHSASTPRT